MNRLHAEATTIESDVAALRDMVLGISESKSLSIYGLGLPPFVCFVIVEAYDWLCRNEIARSHRFLDAEAPRVRRLRSRIKLLDARGGLREVFAGLATIQIASRRIFASATGFRKRLAQVLERDLGLFFVGNDLVCTSHLALLYAGYGNERIGALNHQLADGIGEELNEFAVEMGRVVGDLYGIFSQSAVEATYGPSKGAESLSLRARDHKAARFYPLVEKRLGLPESFGAPLVWLVCQNNYVNLVMRAAIDVQSALYSRLRFLTLYHTLTALRALTQLAHTKAMPDARMHFADILSRPGARRLRRMSRLRRTAAHYVLPQNVALRPTIDTWSALVQHYAGMDRSDFDLLLDQELTAITEWGRCVATERSAGGIPVYLGR